MTQLDEDIKSLDPCPPQEFLQAWATGMLKDRSLQSVIFSHLEFCPSCRQKVREFKRVASPDDDPIAKRAQALRERQLAQQEAVKQGPTPGTIWRTVPESEKDLFGPLVLVLHRQEAKARTTLTVAEVSEDIAQAIHTDMVLEPKESGLRFRFVVRTENMLTTSPDRLTFFAGTLSQSLMDKVLGFCKEAKRFDENIPLSKFVFLKDRQGTQLMRRRGITSGMLVTKEDDPRLEFLQLSRDRCSYLTGKSAATDSSWALARKIQALFKKVAVPFSQSAKILARKRGEWKVFRSNIARIRAENAELKKKAAELTQKLMEAWEEQKNARGGPQPIFSTSGMPALPQLLDPKEGKQILQAVQSGDLDVLIEFVTDERLANFSEEDSKTTPLHLAASNGHLAVAEFLLDKGASLNTQDIKGETALMLAAEKGHRELVKLLLRRKADPGLRSKDGRTAFFCAVKNGHKEIADILNPRIKR